MRIFLDENVPRELAPDFRVGCHQVVHIEDVDMKGTTNGALLGFVSGRFEVPVTGDTNVGVQ